MKLLENTLRSEMYFKTDHRSSSQLCLATPSLGLSISMYSPDRPVLCGEGPMQLELVRELHINNRVYTAQGCVPGSITFLQRGEYYNRADAAIGAFVSQGDEAPVSARFETACIGDSIVLSTVFMMKKEASVAVAVMRLRGGAPVQNGDNAVLTAGGERIFVSTTGGGILEVNGEELIVKQPVMSAADGESYSTSLRFSRAGNRAFFEPALAMCVQGRVAGRLIQSELDRVHGVYILDDTEGEENEIEITVENPFDEPACMPFMFSRKSKIPLGAVLEQEGRQTGIPVQICCERIVRSGGGTGFYDYTAAPVLEAGEKLRFTLRLTKQTCACHLWTHGREAQLGRAELSAAGGSCILDPSRSVMAGLMPSMRSFADEKPRSFSADMLEIIKDAARLELCRIRLTEMFCGQLEARCVHEAYSPGKTVRFTLEHSMLIQRDYTRIAARVRWEALEDDDFEELRIFAFCGQGLYFGDDVSLGCARVLPGEGYRFSRDIGADEFIGFEGMGVCVRRVEGRKLEACVYSREREGEDYCRVVLRTEAAEIKKGENAEYEFCISLLPEADGYAGKDAELRRSLEMRSCGQLMRREAAANRVENIPTVGSGEKTVAVSGGNAEVIQSGGVGMIPIRFTDIETAENISAVSGLKELPVQVERIGEKYSVLAVCTAADGRNQRRISFSSGKAR